MLIIQKLEYLETLTPNEKEVANFILSHQHDIQKISITDIAQQTYTSPSTTVRLSQKLGFHGWKELKSQLIEELQYLNSHFREIDPNVPFKAMDSIQNIAENIAQLLSDSIYDTLKLIDHDQLQKAVLMLNEAKTINIFGISNAVVGAYDFMLKMRAIGKKVYVYDNLDDFPFVIDFTTKDTLSIFISYSGETIELIPFVKSIQNKKFPSIAITSIGGNTLSELTDCQLFITTREKLHSKIASFTSNEGIHFTLDVLYSCVFSKNYQKNWKNKVKMALKYDKYRYSNVQILQEKEM